jgi:hypothetical protein
MGFALSAMTLSSPAFATNGAIPVDYTGSGRNVSPPLAWSDVPDGAKSLAIICHDPDAPIVAPSGAHGIAHWVAYNIPASEVGLAEGQTEGFTTGANQLGKHEYAGPMPPPGHGAHRYYFLLLALDEDPVLEPGLSMNELLARVEPHLLGMNRLVGTYENAG